MTLRKKTLIITSAMLIGLLTIVFISSRLILMAGFARLEQQEAQREVDEVLTLLSLKLNTLGATVTEYAHWDNAYAFAQDFDMGSVTFDVINATLANSRINAVILVQPSGQVIMAKGYDLEKAEVVEVSPELLEQLRSGQPLLQQLTQAGRVEGIVSLAAGPMLVAADAILTSKGEGPSRGILIMGRYADAAEISQITQITGRSLGFHRLDSSVAREDAAVLQSLLSNPAAHVVHSKDTMTRGYALLKDIFGKPALMLRVDIPRTIHAESQNTLRYFLIILALVGLSFGLTTLLFLEKSVLSRVAQLSANVGRIAGSGDSTARIAEGPQDELGKLAGAMNQMLATLDQSRKAQEESAYWLEMLIDQAPMGVFLSADGVIIYANQAAVDMTGYGKDELITRMSPLDLILLEDRPFVQARSLTSKEGVGEATDYTARSRCKDGRIIHCDVMERCVVWQGQQTTLSLVTDITERKQAQDEIERLYENERQRRLLAETLYEAGAVLSATLDLNTVLNCLLEQIHRIVPSDLSVIMLVHEGQARIVRTRGCERCGPQAAQHLAGVTLEVATTANLCQMATTGQPVVIPDTTAYPGWVQVQGVEGIHSWVGAPVVADGETIGFLMMGKNASGYYSPEHGTYVAAFAVQAALALQNAQLHAETVEALERERRYNEITRAISSGMDLPTVLQSVAHLAADLIGAEAGVIGLISASGDEITTPYAFGVPPSPTQQVMPRGEGVSWHVAETGQLVLLPEYSLHPRAQVQWIAAGVHAFIAVPIVAGESRLGVLGLFTLATDKRFTERDAAVAEAIGQQAGSAIQKAHLLEDARRRAQEAETLRAAGAAVVSTLQLHETIERILHQLEHVVPYDSASVQLLRDGHLEIVGGRGWPNPAAVIGTRFPIPGDNPNTQVVRERRPYLLPKAHLTYGPHAEHIQSWLGIPLVMRDRVIGMLTLDGNTPDRFCHEHVRLVSAFADQVAVAIENAGLFERVQQLALTDELTGLYNRRRFFELADPEFRSACEAGRNVCLLMIDIDQFKRVNDTYGHVAGDRVLQEVAWRCRDTLGCNDILARYGGEEFVAMLGPASTAEAPNVAERLRQKVNQACVSYEGQSINVTVSVGVTSLASLATTEPMSARLETLLVEADQAQYAAKRAGGNQVVLWQPVCA